MQVGISCEFMGVKRCGTATFTQNLLRGLRDVAGEHRFVAYLASRAGLPLVEWSEQVQPRLVPPYNAPLRLGLTLPTELLRRPVDLLHANGWGPLWSPCPMVLTVHDLGWERHPEFYPRALRLRLSALVRHSAARAVLIMASSQATARDLIEIYGIAPEKIRVVYIAMDPSFSPVTDAAAKQVVQARYGIAGPYLLYLGSIEPKKNVHLLIEAYARLRREHGVQQKLVLAGTPLWLSQPILELPAKLGIEHDVIFTGQVAQDDLAALYSGADLFAFLGMYEGFGYPPLEAMACGTPVLAADRTSLGEILRGAAALVDPDDQDALVAGLARLLSDEQLRETLRQQGALRTQQFQPAVVAQQMIAVYTECAEHSRATRRTMYER